MNRIKKPTFYIRVMTPNGREYGRDSNGRIYQFISRELAHDAARLWGDAYDSGEVYVTTLAPEV